MTYLRTPKSTKLSVHRQIQCHYVKAYVILKMMSKLPWREGERNRGREEHVSEPRTATQIGTTH